MIVWYTIGQHNKCTIDRHNNCIIIFDKLKNFGWKALDVSIKMCEEIHNVSQLLGPNTYYQMHNFSWFDSYVSSFIF